MTDIEFITAHNGGLVMYADDKMVGFGETVEEVASVMTRHGVDGIIYFSSSMDFATEYGFETNDGALNMWNEAIGIYNWEVNGVAS